MKERIFEIIQQNQLTAWKFAEMLNVQASSISHILSGRNKPSFDFIEKVLTKFPTINPDWLILGKGEMYREDDKPEPATATKNPNSIENIEPTHIINSVDTTTPIEQREQNNDNNTFYSSGKPINDQNYGNIFETSRDEYNNKISSENGSNNRDNLFNSIEIENSGYIAKNNTDVNRNNVDFTRVNHRKYQNFNSNVNSSDATNVITNVNHAKGTVNKYDNTQELLMSALATTDEEIEKIIIFYKGNRFAAYTPKK